VRVGWRERGFVCSYIFNAPRKGIDDKLAIVFARVHFIDMGSTVL